MMLFASPLTNCQLLDWGYPHWPAHSLPLLLPLRHRSFSQSLTPPAIQYPPLYYRHSMMGPDFSAPTGTQ
mgnify:CR=1 FL=1